jgi:hypothetical protein
MWTSLATPVSRTPSSPRSQKEGLTARVTSDIIIFSIGYMILVRVTDGKVLHTKCLPFVHSDKYNMTFDRCSEREDDGPLNQSNAVFHPESEDLVDRTITHRHAFYLLALVFEGASFESKLLGREAARLNANLITDFIPSRLLAMVYFRMRCMLRSSITAAPVSAMPVC